MAGFRRPQGLIIDVAAGQAHPERRPDVVGPAVVAPVRRGPGHPDVGGDKDLAQMMDIRAERA